MHMKTMNTSRAFIDSNILVYLISGETLKADRAEVILRKGPVISVQVLNEFASVARRKYKLKWSEIAKVISLARATCEIVPITLAVHELAIRTAEECSIGVYDACIVAAAELSGCDVLLTEDMNDGQQIGAVKIRNPFDKW